MLGNLPYFIALDREHEAVVIAFRGTYSVADVFTDAVALPQRADVWLSPSLRQVRAADLACFEQLCLSQFASPKQTKRQWRSSDDVQSSVCPACEC